MANPFDQFDVVERNPFDQFDAPLTNRKPSDIPWKSVNGKRVSTDPKVILSDYGRRAKPAPGLTYEEAGLQYVPATWEEIATEMKKSAMGALRGIGRVSKNVAQGVPALPGTLADAPARIYEGLSGNQAPAALKPYQSYFNALESPVLADRNADERVSSDIQRGMASTLGSMGVGSALAGSTNMATRGIGQALQTNPGAQLTSSATGATASGVTREMGGGPIAQFAAGIAGGLAPPLLSAGAQELVRRTLRGGAEGQALMQENLQNFDETGATPSVGQASQKRTSQALESYLSKAPGGAGRMSKVSSQQADDIAQGLEQTASTLSPGASAEQTGRAITKGLSGSGGFTEQFKTKQTELYDKLDQFIEPAKRVNVERTKEALSKLNADIPGAPAVSKLFKNSKIQGIETALKSDTEGMSSVAANPELSSAFKGAKLSAEDSTLINDFLVDKKLPFEALKKLRTLVGDQISDWTIVSDVPRSKLKALYGALSEDLGSAAKEAGPKATEAWLRANRYTRAGMDRLDVLENVLDRSGGPEAVYRAATSGTKEGASTLRAVMQSLPVDAQKKLAATMVRRLGTAKAGVQNEVGDVFSTETFLTNWNLLSPEAKRAAFDRFGPGFSNSMDTVAKVAANLRQGSQVFRNPSGTGQATALGTTVGGAAMAMLTGHPGYAAGIAGYAAANNAAARLMTNPRFVNWLALSTKAPISALPTLANQLAQSATRSGDTDAADFALRLRFQQGANQTEAQDQ